MADVELCTDQLQRDKCQDDGSSAGQTPDGQTPDCQVLGGQPPRNDYPHQSQDGIFERFLSSAIVAILTILFSWRMLMLTSTDNNRTDHSDGQCARRCVDHQESTKPEAVKQHNPDMPLGSGKVNRDTESNHSVSDLPADHNHFGPLMKMAGQSPVGDGSRNSNIDRNSRSLSPSDNNPAAVFDEETDVVKWAERSWTTQCDSGELSSAANRYAGNTGRGRPQILKAGCDSNLTGDRNGEYIGRKGVWQVRNVSEGKDEGQQRFVSHSLARFGDWEQLQGRNITTETKSQGCQNFDGNSISQEFFVTPVFSWTYGEKSGVEANANSGLNLASEEDKARDCVQTNFSKHPLPISLPTESSHGVRPLSAEISSKTEKESSDTVSLTASAAQKMDRYQLVPVPTDEELDFWGPDEGEEEKDDGRLSRTGFHDMEPWDPIDYDNGSALEAYFEQDYFDSSEESEESEFLCDRRLETILEEEEEEENSEEEEEEDEEDISEEEAKEEEESEKEEDEVEMDDKSTEEMFTGPQDIKIMDEVLSEDVSSLQNSEVFPEDDGKTTELNSEFDQCCSSIHTHNSPSAADSFSLDSSVKIPKNSDIKKHVTTTGRIESHKVLSEVRDLFSALVQSNCGVQSGAPFKQTEKLGSDSFAQDVDLSFDSRFRTESLEREDAEWCFPAPSPSSAAGSFMPVTDLDDGFEEDLLNRQNEVPLTMASDTSVLVLDIPMQSDYVVPTDNFLVAENFGQMAVEGIREASGNDNGCVEEIEDEREYVHQKMAREEENNGLWVSEARIIETSETFVCKTVLDDKNEVISEKIPAPPDGGRFSKENYHNFVTDSPTDSVQSSMRSDVKETEKRREEIMPENNCSSEEHEHQPDLESESRPSLKTELTVQFMYPHTQNLLKFISSEVIHLRRSDADQSSDDEVRLKGPFENGGKQLHQPRDAVPEKGLSMRNSHTDESHGRVKESMEQTKSQEKLKGEMTSTCIMSESAKSTDLAWLRDGDWLKSFQPTYEEGVAKRSETMTKKLEKTSDGMISKDNSAKTVNQKESNMMAHSESLQTSMPFISNSSRKLKIVNARENDLSKRINSPKPSRKVFSVIDISLDADPSLSSGPRTNFEELKQKLASVRLRAPPSPIPDELWNSADEILARFRSHDRGLNAPVQDGLTTDSTDKVDAAIRQAKSLSLLPNSYRGVKNLGHLSHDPTDNLVQSSSALNDHSPSSASVNSDKSVKSQSLLDLRNNTRLSVFSGNNLKNQDKSLSKSELRLYESLQQLDIPDWFQNSARRHQEIVILKNARSVENILSDCFSSSAEYRHRAETKGPVAPKPVVIAHYVSMPTYEIKQATKAESLVTKFELPSAKMRERSRSPFHPIKTLSFEEIMKSAIKVQRANGETKNEIDESSENSDSKEELLRKHSVEKIELISHEETQESSVQEVLPGTQSVQEINPKYVNEVFMPLTTEELLPVARQLSIKKDNEEVHSSEEKQPGRHSVKRDSPTLHEEILSSSELIRKTFVHEERYPPSVAETQLLRRNSLKKSNLAFSEEKYPFSTTQKHSVKDQISNDYEGELLSRAETETISREKDSENQGIKMKKVTKKSKKSELLPGEKKKKKLKKSCESSHLENTELDAEGTARQVEQSLGFEGEFEEEEAPKEPKRRIKKKSTRTGKLGEAAEKEASVSDPPPGDILWVEANELLTYEQKTEQEDPRRQTKRRNVMASRRKRTELQERNGLQEFDNSNQNITSGTDVDSGIAVLDNNYVKTDDFQRVQAYEHSYDSLGKQVNLKKPKPTKMSETELEILESFENQDSSTQDVMCEIEKSIQKEKSNKKKKKKPKELHDLDLGNESLQTFTNSRHLDLTTSQELSTDDSSADLLKKSQRKLKTKFQEVDKTVVNSVNISESNKGNALEAVDQVVSVDNKVKVSRKKVKRREKEDSHLPRDQSVQISLDNREFTETSSLEVSEMTDRTYDSQVSVSDSQSQKPLRKVKRKRIVDKSENITDGFQLNREVPNNDNLYTGTNVRIKLLTDEVKMPEESRLGNDRVSRKIKEEVLVEDMPVMSDYAKPKPVKKLNEKDASVMSDSVKVRKRIKNRVSEISNSDHVVNANDCFASEHSSYYPNQVDRLLVTHSEECSVSRDNLNDNQENILSDASSVAVRELKKTKKKRVTDAAANETESGFILSKVPLANPSPRQVRARLANATQGSSQCTAESSTLVHKARTSAAAALLYSPQSGQQTGHQAVDQLVEFEQQQF